MSPEEISPKARVEPPKSPEKIKRLMSLKPSLIGNSLIHLQKSQPRLAKQNKTQLSILAVIFSIISHPKSQPPLDHVTRVSLREPKIKGTAHDIQKTAASTAGNDSETHLTKSINYNKQTKKKKRFFFLQKDKKCFGSGQTEHMLPASKQGAVPAASIQIWR